MSVEKKVIEAKSLESNIRVWEIMAQFGSLLNQDAIDYLKEDGLGDGRMRAVGCMGWIPFALPVQD